MSTRAFGVRSPVATPFAKSRENELVNAGSDPSISSAGPTGQPSGTASRTKVLACRVVAERLEQLVPPEVVVESLEMSLHERPLGLRSALQESIDACAGRYETIVLGYGLCGQAVVGLWANACRLVIPRADDCIGIFLGTREAYRARVAEEPGTFFLTRGWLGEDVSTPFRAHERLAERWGKERADRMMGAVLRNYRRLVFIRTGDEQDLAADREQAAELAERFGLRYEEIDGTNALVERLVCGPWDGDFVVVPPGATVALADFLGDDPSAHL